MHHRKHAAEFLSKAGDAAARAGRSLNVFARKIDLSNQINANYLSSAQTSILMFLKLAIDTAAQIHIVEPAGLDTIRRLVNRPNLDDPPSLLSWLQDATYLTGQLTKTQSGNELADAIRDISHAWEFVDLASWHVIDAIREEIYNDPIFGE